MPANAPAKIARDTLSVARFETLRTLGSVRGLLVLLLYLAASALTGAFYVVVVRGFEDKAMEFAGKVGADVGDKVDITKVDAYQKLVDNFAGDDSAKAALWKTTPPIVIVSFWLALGFLPFLVMLTSHDALARDNELRTLRYVRPRLSMGAWVVGKFAAQTLLVFAVTVASGFLIYGIAVARLDSFAPLAGGLAFLTFWWRVLVFEMGMLGVLFVISAISRTAFAALVLSAFALFVLWLLQFFQWWKNGEELAPVGYLSYISPFTYKDGLWYPMGQTLAISVIAYIGFAALGVGLAIFSLDKRDI